MDPWTLEQWAIFPWMILGWFLLGGVVLWTLGQTFRMIAVVYDVVKARVVLYWKHLRTRNIPPEKGQCWIQFGRALRIDRIADNGRIMIKTANASFSDSPEEWQDRMRRCRLYLEK